MRFYQEIGLDNPLPPARPYFAAFDEATHDFVLVLEDLGRLRVADQIVGCTAADAETVIDAIAGHHAYWWESDRLASLPWLKRIRHTTVPRGFGQQLRGRLAARSSRGSAPTCPRNCVPSASGSPSMVPWFFDQIARPPHTFLHGDLRLDQLFFAVGADDPPVTALDWQITIEGTGRLRPGLFPEPEPGHRHPARLRGAS